MSEAYAHPNYIKIWFWLLGLLVISVAGPMLEIPALTIITAFGIAIVKAYLVAANFMHLKFEKKIHLVFTDSFNMPAGSFLFRCCTGCDDDRRRPMDRLYCRQILC